MHRVGNAGIFRDTFTLNSRKNKESRYYSSLRNPTRLERLASPSPLTDERLTLYLAYCTVKIVIQPTQSGSTVKLYECYKYINRY